MATIKVSGQAQLLSAFKSAKAGDVLSLAGGNYGSVTLASGKSGVTIKSASDSNQAVFTKLSAQSVSNFAIDNVKFDGTGGGTGLTIKNSTNVKVLNSDFTDYKIGSFIYEIKGLTVSNNTFTRMYHDAMNFTDINGGTISKNVYRESGSQPGYTHKDFIQFWTNKAYGQEASKNINIVGNQFYSKDGDTHGIFIHNEWKGQKYQNIYIADNYIKSSHTHGITVTYGDKVEIKNNTLIKDGKGYPVINVTPDSTNVKITNNTAPAIPDVGNSTWSLSGNKETGGTSWTWTDGLSGSTVKNTGSTTGASTSASSASSVATTTSTAADTSDTSLGNGKADEFRFDAAKISGGVTKVVSSLDFSDKDTIVLINYDKGTIKDVEGGNLVWHNLEGTYVKIDSLTDIQEIVAASPKIAAKISGDDVKISITQSDGTHHIVLDGMAHQYQSTFDSTLF